MSPLSAQSLDWARSSGSVTQWVRSSESVTQAVMVRRAPSSTSAAVGRLEPGERAAFVDAKTPDWYLVRLADGSEGYVSRAWTTLHREEPATVSSPDGALAPDSPLATDGRRLFAVAPDGRTILARPVSLETAWTPVESGAKIRKIGGLAAGPEALFVSDIETATILRIDSSGRVETLHQGEPLQGPSDLALDKALFVVDVGADRLFSVGLGSRGSSLEPVSKIPPPIGENSSIAYRRDTLVYSDGFSIKRLVGASNAATERVEYLQEKSEVEPQPRKPGESRTAFEGSSGSDYPRIAKPVSLAAMNGLVYAASGETGLIYSTPRFVARAINSTFGLRPGDRPSFRNVAVTKEWLFAVDAVRGDVVRWPRPVPTELTLTDARSECMSALFAYLTSRDALPSRRARLGSSLERTLRDEKVLQYPYVKALDDVICALNPFLCQGGSPGSVVEGQSIHVPDIFVEGVLAYRRVPLDGKTPLSRVVDSSLTNPEFDYAKDEEFLRKLNRNPELKEGESLRQQMRGEYVLPQQVVRFVVAVPESDLLNGKAGPAFEAIRSACPGVTINPLERRDAAASGNGDCAADWGTIDQSRAALLKSVHSEAVPPSPMVEVAIVEGDVDRAHPDFATAGGIESFATNEWTQRGLISGNGATAQARCFEENDDHGTAVTALIGAQRWRSNNGLVAGLAPAAQLTLFPRDLATLNHAIETTPNSGTIAVMNISRKTDADDGWLTVIQHNQQMLFVVAAGNGRHTHDLCERSETLVYPACYGTTVDNLIAVGATTLDGQQWLDADTDNEGSNYGPKYVHVAAPGVGFWSAGKDWSYVPVRGTSFATPLVAATAAHLAAQNISPPWRIKYRIIATADPVPALDKKVMGGVLNMDRAVTNVRQTLITRGGQTKGVFLEPAQQIGIPIDGAQRTIKLDHILRLTRRGTTYRIIYEDDSENLRVSNGARLSADLQLTIRYRTADPGTGSPAGATVSESLSGIEDFIGAVPGWTHRSRSPL